MADEEKSPKPIKVVDRRWFTQRGEPREEARPVKRREPDQAPVPSAEARQPRQTAADRERAPESTPRPEGTTAGSRGLGFATLVEFLAQQALVLLTGAEGLEPNREQAKVFIDLLGILGEKTKGNLTDDEKRMLDDVLFQLRAAFVQAGR